jgi:dihydroxyacid dehydratase/phosphogluconate dehydratase
VAVLTDARFSGVSTGACIGHISPEALAGGPIGKVLDGDVIEIVVDRVNLEGSVNLVGHRADVFGAAEGTRVLAARPMLRTWRQIRRCLRRPGCGRRCSRRAGGRGAGVCMIRTLF